MTEVLLLVLAALWGSSYMFIKIGLDDLSPAMIVLTRTLLGALVLTRSTPGASDALGRARKVAIATAVDAPSPAPSATSVASTTACSGPSTSRSHKGWPAGAGHPRVLREARAIAHGGSPGPGCSGGGERGGRRQA